MTDLLLKQLRFATVLHSSFQHSWSSLELRISICSSAIWQPRKLYPDIVVPLSAVQDDQNAVEWILSDQPMLLFRHIDHMQSEDILVTCTVVGLRSGMTPNSPYILAHGALPFSLASIPLIALKTLFDPSTDTQAPLELALECSSIGSPGTHTIPSVAEYLRAYNITSANSNVSQSFQEICSQLAPSCTLHFCAVGTAGSVSSWEACRAELTSRGLRLPIRSDPLYHLSNEPEFPRNDLFVGVRAANGLSSIVGKSRPMLQICVDLAVEHKGRIVPVEAMVQRKWLPRPPAPAAVPVGVGVGVGVGVASHETESSKTQPTTVGTPLSGQSSCILIDPMLHLKKMPVFQTPMRSAEDVCEWVNEAIEIDLNQLSAALATYESGSVLGSNSTCFVRFTLVKYETLNEGSVIGYSYLPIRASGVHDACLSFAVLRRNQLMPEQGVLRIDLPVFTVKGEPSSSQVDRYLDPSNSVATVTVELNCLRSNNICHPLMRFLQQCGPTIDLPSLRFVLDRMESVPAAYVFPALKCLSGMLQQVGHEVGSTRGSVAGSKSDSSVRFDILCKVTVHALASLASNNATEFSVFPLEDIIAELSVGDSIRSLFLKQLLKITDETFARYTSTKEVELLNVFLKSFPLVICIVLGVNPQKHVSINSSTSGSTVPVSAASSTRASLSRFLGRVSRSSSRMSSSSFLFPSDDDPLVAAAAQFRNDLTELIMFVCMCGVDSSQKLVDADSATRDTYYRVLGSLLNRFQSILPLLWRYMHRELVHVLSQYLTRLLPKDLPEPLSQSVLDFLSFLFSHESPYAVPLTPVFKKVLQKYSVDLIDDSNTDLLLLRSRLVRTSLTYVESVCDSVPLFVTLVPHVGRIASELLEHAHLGASRHHKIEEQVYELANVVESLQCMFDFITAATEPILTELNLVLSPQSAQSQSQFLSELLRLIHLGLRLSKDSHGRGNEAEPSPRGPEATFDSGTLGNGALFLHLTHNVPQFLRVHLESRYIPSTTVTADAFGCIETLNAVLTICKPKGLDALAGSCEFDEVTRQVIRGLCRLFRLMLSIDPTTISDLNQFAADLTPIAFSCLVILDSLSDSEQSLGKFDSSPESTSLSYWNIKTENYMDMLHEVIRLAIVVNGYPNQLLIQKSGASDIVAAVTALIQARIDTKDLPLLVPLLAEELYAALLLPYLANWSQHGVFINDLTLLLGSSVPEILSLRPLFVLLDSLTVFFEPTGSREVEVDSGNLDSSTNQHDHVLTVRDGFVDDLLVLLIALSNTFEPWDPRISFHFLSLIVNATATYPLHLQHALVSAVAAHFAESLARKSNQQGDSHEIEWLLLAMRMHLTSAHEFSKLQLVGDELHKLTTVEKLFHSRVTLFKSVVVLSTVVQQRSQLERELVFNASSTSSELKSSQASGLDVLLSQYSYFAVLMYGQDLDELDLNRHVFIYEIHKTDPSHASASSSPVSQSQNHDWRKVFKLLTSRLPNVTVLTVEQEVVRTVRIFSQEYLPEDVNELQVVSNSLGAFAVIVPVVPVSFEYSSLMLPALKFFTPAKMDLFEVEEQQKHVIFESHVLLPYCSRRVSASIRLVSTQDLGQVQAKASVLRRQSQHS